jgi:chromosome segregation ATPase
MEKEHEKYLDIWENKQLKLEELLYTKIETLKNQNNEKSLSFKKNSVNSNQDKDEDGDDVESNKLDYKRELEKTKEELEEVSEDYKKALNKIKIQSNSIIDKKETIKNQDKIISEKDGVIVKQHNKIQELQVEIEKILTNSCRYDNALIKCSISIVNLMVNLN